MAGIPFVFTIARVAELLGEDEDWLHELSIAMDPEDGCLWVLDVGEREVPAFTEYGIECLKEIIANLRLTQRHEPLRCSPEAYLQKDTPTNAIGGTHGTEVNCDTFPRQTSRGKHHEISDPAFAFAR
jgi:hypothetical protein